MKTLRTKTTLLIAAGAAILLLAGSGRALASSISMPAGSRSWILVGSGDCDDDGPNVNVDRGHCIGAVSVLNQPGDIGHGQFSNHFIFASATIGPETMRGAVQNNTGGGFAFMDLSMVDTYTLNSASLPAGTVVPITVSFQAVGTMTIASGLGSGVFTIRIGTALNPDPIVIPENTRVLGNLGPASQPPAFSQFFVSGTFSLDQTATATMNVAIGTPFDLAFYLGARPSNATIDFSNTATISFNVPAGTRITSTGGYGEVVPVEPSTWSGLKTRYYR